MRLFQFLSPQDLKITSNIIHHFFDVASREPLLNPQQSHQFKPFGRTPHWYKCNQSVLKKMKQQRRLMLSLKGVLQGCDSLRQQLQSTFDVYNSVIIKANKVRWKKYHCQRHLNSKQRLRWNLWLLACYID